MMTLIMTTMLMKITKMMMETKMMVMVTMSHDRESIDRLILQTVAVPHGPNLSGNDCSQRTDRHQLPLSLLRKNPLLYSYHSLFAFGHFLINYVLSIHMSWP